MERYSEVVKIRILININNTIIALRIFVSSGAGAHHPHDVTGLRKSGNNDDAKRDESAQRTRRTVSE